MKKCAWPSCSVSHQDRIHCPVVEGECGHIFHKHCIDEWLESHHDCPIIGCKSNSFQNIDDQNPWIK